MPEAVCPCVCGCPAMAGGYKRIQELKMTSEPADLEGAVNDDSTECGVWQQIIDPVLSTNGIWRAAKQKWRVYNISRW